MTETHSSRSKTTDDYSPAWHILSKRAPRTVSCHGASAQLSQATVCFQSIHFTRFDHLCCPGWVLLVTDIILNSAFLNSPKYSVSQILTGLLHRWFMPFSHLPWRLPGATPHPAWHETFSHLFQKKTEITYVTQVWCYRIHVSPVTFAELCLIYQFWLWPYNGAVCSS